MNRLAQSIRTNDNECGHSLCGTPIRECGNKWTLEKGMSMGHSYTDQPLHCWVLLASDCWSICYVCVSKVEVVAFWRLSEVWWISRRWSLLSQSAKMHRKYWDRMPCLEGKTQGNCSFDFSGHARHTVWGCKSTSTNECQMNCSAWELSHHPTGFTSGPPSEDLKWLTS